MTSDATSKFETATFAGGCFWCLDVVFTRLKGVKNVVSGYSGGSTENPTDTLVYSGTTGHAESIQISYDPSIISYEKLLEIFFHLHDPTTLNRQDNDEGPMYRSAIFYHDENQHKTAEEVKNIIAKSGKYSGEIVTEIVPFTKFYPAESYHQDYYRYNSYQPYCQYVIDPKIQKLLKEYRKEVKEEYLNQ